MPARRPIPIGGKFGRLTVVRNSIQRQEANSRRYYCEAVCECGGVVVAREASLLSGSTVSCGCAQRDWVSMGRSNLRHGHANSPTYSSWQNMITRCTNTNAIEYSSYGGRGIGVCPRWSDFANFLKDMGVRPSPHHSIDRIKNDGNYEPKNCQWASKRMQSENTSQVILITIGTETMSFSAAARRVGRSPATVHEWMAKHGLTHQQAIDRYLSK